MLAPLIKPSSVGSYCKVWIMKWCNSVTLYKVALHYCDTIQGDRSLQPLTTDSGTQINSAPKSSIRRFVITEKAPTRARDLNFS